MQRCFKLILFNKTYFQYYQAKVQTLNTVKFALGWCGNDKTAKTLPFIASGAGESFCLLFSKKSESHCPA
jgi:hypothetical protein